VSSSKVGGTRKIIYKDGTVQRFRLTELSDAQHSLTYEVVESQPEVKYMSAIHTVTLTRVSTLNQTLVELISDFSKDAGMDVIQDAKYKKVDFIRQLASAVEPKPVKLFRQVSMRTQKFDKVTGSQVEEAWKAFDKSDSGCLDKSQMKDVIEGLLTKVQKEQKDIRAAVASMFAEANKEQKSEVKPDSVADEIFKSLQKGRDAVVRELVAKLDINKDGKVDFPEFRLLFANWFANKIQDGIRVALK
jgi:Ca2+-binding EF-hand superfamily protein